MKKIILALSCLVLVGVAALIYSDSGTSATVTNINGGVTNIFTMSPPAVPYYPNALGITYGTSDGYLGFWGKTPTNQITVAYGAGDATTVSNLVAALKAIGIIK